MRIRRGLAHIILPGHDSVGTRYMTCLVPCESQNNIQQILEEIRTERLHFILEAQALLLSMSDYARNTVEKPSKSALQHGQRRLTSHVLRAHSICIYKLSRESSVRDISQRVNA